MEQPGPGERFALKCIRFVSHANGASFNFRIASLVLGLL